MSAVRNPLFAIRSEIYACVRVKKKRTERKTISQLIPGTIRNIIYSLNSTVYQIEGFREYTILLFITRSLKTCGLMNLFYVSRFKDDHIQVTRTVLL